MPRTVPLRRPPRMDPLPLFLDIHDRNLNPSSLHDPRDRLNRTQKYIAATWRDMQPELPASMPVETQGSPLTATPFPRTRGAESRPAADERHTHANHRKTAQRHHPRLGQPG